MSGVVWGEPTEAGSWAFTVRVIDSKNDTYDCDFHIQVEQHGSVESALVPSWLWNGPDESDDLRVDSSPLPPAVVGKPYSAVLSASGGSPYIGTRKPGKGRYWEFAPRTLEQALLEDRVVFGQRGDAIPAIKRYIRPEETEAIKVQSVWLGRDSGAEDRGGVGYTQDATRHLKALEAVGAIREAVTTSKPEQLVARLMDIFTVEGDFVLELFTSASDLSSVALKKGRRFVSVVGGSRQAMHRLEATSKPRLQAVIDGLDRDLEGAGDQQISEDRYIPFDGGGSALFMQVADPIAVRTAIDEYPQLTSFALALSDTDLRAAILSAEGFVPAHDRFVHGWALDRRRAAHVVASTDYLTLELLSELAGWAEASRTQLDLFYFKCEENVESSTRSEQICLRRVPMDLRL